jgi:flagellar biosynthesis/type III secretory pathway M-ring protein FliF/YscJ
MLSIALIAGLSIAISLAVAVLGAWVIWRRIARARRRRGAPQGEKARLRHLHTRARRERRAW